MVSRARCPARQVQVPAASLNFVPPSSSSFPSLTPLTHNARTSTASSTTRTQAKLGISQIGPRPHRKLSKMSSAPLDMPEQTKLYIPHPNVTPSIDIVGLLSQRTPFAALPSPSDASYASLKAAAPRRPLALILHGVLAHKDQTYHKRLVASLSVDSFRFDFRGNHETPGEWTMAHIERDVEDIRAVVEYLRERYAYAVELVVGHSRGAVAGWMYFATYAEEMKRDKEWRVPYYASVSGRWRMDKIENPTWLAAFAKEGFFRWKVRVAGADREVIVRPEEVNAFKQIPVSEYVARFPAESDCLLIHGTKDEVVPTADVGYYANALTGPGRRPGSCKMHLVDDAGHNFNKACYAEVAQAICTWFDERRAAALQTDEIAARAGLPLSPASTSTATAGGEKGAAVSGEVLERSWRSSTESEAAQGKGRL